MAIVNVGRFQFGQGKGIGERDDAPPTNGSPCPWDLHGESARCSFFDVEQIPILQQVSSGRHRQAGPASASFAIPCYFGQPLIWSAQLSPGVRARVARVLPPFLLQIILIKTSPIKPEDLSLDAQRVVPELETKFSLRSAES